MWRDRGLITACPGYKVDYRYVTDWFIKLRDEYGITAYWCGYDSWNSPSWTEDMENRLGYKLKLNLLPVIMGPKTLSAPMKMLKADLAAKLISYNNNPVLKWCLTNTSVEIDKNENIRPLKNNQRQRIDLAVALLIAYTVYQNNQADYLALTGE
jgi:phage terminase large subunit-like protein